jgi:hypothetical protein
MDSQRPKTAYSTLAEVSLDTMRDRSNGRSPSILSDKGAADHDTLSKETAGGEKIGLLEDDPEAQGLRLAEDYPSVLGAPFLRLCEHQPLDEVGDNPHPLSANTTTRKLPPT